MSTICQRFYSTLPYNVKIINITLEENMTQNLNYLESLVHLPLTHVKSFTNISDECTYPLMNFLLPKTAAVLHLNGLLKLKTLTTVQTEHAPFQRLSGVITALSHEAREFMEHNKQFVNFYDGIACFQIIDERIISEIERLSSV